MTPRAAVLALASALCGALLPAVASAETFVAAPDATRATTPCTTATPCDLAFALTAPGSADDRVEVRGGTYAMTGGGKSTRRSARWSRRPGSGRRSPATS